MDGPDRPELIGYVDPFVAHAGEAMELMVSTTAATWDYRVVRLLHGDRNPAGPGFKVAEVRPRMAGTGLPGGLQVTHAGSFAQAPPLPGLAAAKRVQLRLWAQPTLVGDGRRQVLLSSHDGAGGPGFELALTGEGCFELKVGGGSASRCPSRPVPGSGAGSPPSLTPWRARWPWRSAGRTASPLRPGSARRSAQRAGPAPWTSPSAVRS